MGAGESATAPAGGRSPLTGGLTILVGFIHDFAAGIWAACTFAIWWLERAMDSQPGALGAAAGAAANPALAALERQFFYMALACVAVVLAAGAGRTFTYVSGVYGPEAEAQRKRMLLVKHVVLLVVFALGTMWQYAMVFR